MNIFPAELSEAVLLRRPGDLLHKVKMLENDEALPGEPALFMAEGNCAEAPLHAPGPGHS